ncbi:THAP-type domain-containing protein [Camponotus japonicus]
MPVCCCIKYCKNTKRQKDSKIIYRRFPFKRFKEIIKYWIAATERDNWILYSDALIYSMHFVHDDYYDINSSKKRYLKPNAMPTQNVHANILQYIQQSIAHKINEYNPNNDILEEEVTNNQ